MNMGLRWSEKGGHPPLLFHHSYCLLIVCRIKIDLHARGQQHRKTGLRVSVIPDSCTPILFKKI
jgi:hypothetical protein